MELFPVLTFGLMALSLTKKSLGLWKENAARTQKATCMNSKATQWLALSSSLTLRRMSSMIWDLSMISPKLVSIRQTPLPIQSQIWQLN